MTSNAGCAEARDDGPVLRWTPLVERIRAGDDSAAEELYSRLSTGLRILIARQLGAQDLHDRIHDVFVVVLKAIRTGRLREPESLIGFARAVMRRHVAGCIRDICQRRLQDPGTTSLDYIALDQHSPEDMVLKQERTAIAYRALKRLRRRDRDILTRFYLSDQTEEQICEEMNLTSTQFRLAKSRAKAAFGEIGGRMVGQRLTAHSGGNG